MRALLLMVVLALAVAVFGFGWRPALPAGVSSSSTQIDVSKARERGAELGEKAAEVATQIQDSVAEAGITSKVKAKMALDDLVKARNVGVSTKGTVVTLTGRVGSKAERERATRLAEETDGVTRVVDRLDVE